MSLAEVLNPDLDTDVPMMSQLLNMFALAIFVTIGGHRLVLGGLMDTFVAMPAAPAPAGFVFRDAGHALAAELRTGHPGRGSLHRGVAFVQRRAGVDYPHVAPVERAFFRLWLALGDLCGAKRLAGNGGLGVAGRLDQAWQLIVKCGSERNGECGMGNGNVCGIPFPHSASHPFDIWSRETKKPRKQRRIAGSRPASKGRSCAARIWVLRCCCSAALLTLYWLSGSLIGFFGNLGTEQWGGQAWLSADNQFVTNEFLRLLWLLAAVGLPLLGVILLVAVMSNILQVGLLFLPEKVAPDISRIDPLQGLQRLFSMAGVVRLVLGLLQDRRRRPRSASGR